MFIDVAAKLYFLFIRDSHSIVDITLQRGREELKEENDIKIIWILLWVLFSPK